MNAFPWAHLIVFVVCLVLAGVASAGHAAFSHLNAAMMRRLMQRGASRAQAMVAVARDPMGLLSGVSFLLILALAAAGAITVDVGWRYRLDPIPLVVLMAVTFSLLLIVYDLGHGVASVHPEHTGELLVGPIRLVSHLSAGFRAIERLIGALLFRRGRTGEPPSESFAISEEDLRTAVELVDETEELEQEEREMITSIFEMSDRDVSEIMVPRVDIVAVGGDNSVSEGLDLAIKVGHSRLIVFDGDLDHILGVVHLRDLAATLRTPGAEAQLAALARPVHVVPEGKKIDELLRDFQALHAQIALVVDEYGGTAGIVTIEDLLEEIVGEIRDEYDTEEDAIQKISDTEAIMDGGVSIHDANEALDLDLDDMQYDTIGGLVFDRLGKVPSPGDLVVLDGCTIQVVATVGRRVRRVQVRVTEEPKSPEPAS
ncbi:MAG TPA: hemolysin family protein [Chloroflexota bacterium]